MSSITPITLNRYNLWGDKTPPYERFANNPPFVGQTPLTHTGISLTQLRDIEFNEDDENKLLQVDGDFVNVGDAIPKIMQGMYDYDGAGPLEFMLHDTSLLFTRETMGELDVWQYETQGLDLTREALNLTNCQFLTHIVLTIALESPTIEMLFNLGNIPCYFKAGSNILNNATYRKMEVNTYVLTMPYDENFHWQDTLTFKYRTSGKFAIRLRGLLVRSILGPCEDPDPPNPPGVGGPCCDYTLDGLPAILGSTTSNFGNGDSPIIQPLIV